MWFVRAGRAGWSSCSCASSPEDEAAEREGIAAYFPDANGPTRRMVACMFTTSPDEHFILDRHPAMDDVFVAAGFSGHGYKFCSVIGRITADFCLGEEGKWGVEGFGLGGGEGIMKYPKAPKHLPDTRAIRQPAHPYSQTSWENLKRCLVATLPRQPLAWVQVLQARTKCHVAHPCRQYTSNRRNFN